MHDAKFASEIQPQTLGSREVKCSGMGAKVLHSPFDYPKKAVTRNKRIQMALQLAVGLEGSAFARQSSAGRLR